MNYILFDPMSARWLAAPTPHDTTDKDIWTLDRVDARRFDSFYTAREFGQLTPAKYTIEVQEIER